MNKLVAVLAACLVAFAVAQDDEGPVRPEIVTEDNNLHVRVPRDKEVYFTRYRRESVSANDVMDTVDAAQDLYDNTENALGQAQNTVDAAVDKADVLNAHAEVEALANGLDGAATKFDADVLKKSIDNAKAMASQAASDAASVESDAEDVSDYAESIDEVYTETAEIFSSTVSEDLASVLADMDSNATDFNQAMDMLEASIQTELKTVSDALKLAMGNLTQLKTDLADTDFVKFREDYGVVFDRAINMAGVDPKKPIYRWAAFGSYGYNGWYAGNNADMFGGINPSNWGDSSSFAWQLGSNFDQLRSLINKPGKCGKNCMLISESWYSTSSTESKYFVLAFRIRNTGSTTIEWPLSFYYSTYDGWGEESSMSINGASTWRAGGTDCYSCKRDITIDVPGNRISTVIFTIGSGPSSSNVRHLSFGFINDCLELPDGLEYVDDLDYVTGNWR